MLVDAFKDSICAALEGYSAQIDTLKAEMDASAATAARIDGETRALDSRFVLVEPGEACAVCGEGFIGPKILGMELRTWRAC